MFPIQFALIPKEQKDLVYGEFLVTVQKQYLKAVLAF